MNGSTLRCTSAAALGCFLMLSAAPAEGALVNLMSNAGFEDGLTGYTMSNGFTAPNDDATYEANVTDALPRSGAMSAALSVNNNGVGAPGQYLLYQDIDVSSYDVGEVFTVSGYAAQSPTDPLVDGPVMLVYVEWLNDAGGRTDIDFGFPGGVPPLGDYPADASWNVELTKDNEETVTARYFFGIQNGAVPTGAGTAHFDDLSFSVIPEPASLALLASGGLMMLRRRRG